jgi:hypothetical protein
VNQPGSLSYLDATGEKIDSRLKISDFDSLGFGIERIERNRYFGVVQIDGVECGLLLQKIGIVDVQREIAYLGNDGLPAIALVDLDIFGNETPERVQSQTPDTNLETEPLKLFAQKGAPMLAKSLMVKVVTAPAEDDNGRDQY